MTTNGTQGGAASRRVIAELVLSMDGRVNGKGGPYDMGWIVPHAISDTARDRTVAFTETASTALLGRTNYEGFAGFWPSVADDESADPRDRAFSRWFTNVEKVVFSTTLSDGSLPNTKLTSVAPAEVVADLKNQPGGDIIVLSSSSVIRALLDAGQVDRLSILLAPEMSGGGTRLFDDSLAKREEWTLSNHRATETGAVILDYDRKD